MIDSRRRPGRPRTLTPEGRRLQLQEASRRYRQRQKTERLRAQAARLAYHWAETRDPEHKGEITMMADSCAAWRTFASWCIGGPDGNFSLQAMLTNGRTWSGTYTGEEVLSCFAAWLEVGGELRMGRLR